MGGGQVGPYPSHGLDGISIPLTYLQHKHAQSTMVILYKNGSEIMSLFGNLFGGLFDLNGNGKTDWFEEPLAPMMMDELLDDEDDEDLGDFEDDDWDL